MNLNDIVVLCGAALLCLGIWRAQEAYCYHVAKSGPQVWRGEVHSVYCGRVGRVLWAETFTASDLAIIYAKRAARRLDWKGAISPQLGIEWGVCRVAADDWKPEHKVSDEQAS